MTNLQPPPVTDPSATELLQSLLRLAGLESTFDSDISIEGADPAFATRFRLGTAGAAAVGATLVAAAGLWQHKTGHKQRIELSIRETAAALRSDAYLRIQGKPPPNAWAPISGFYQTADGGWIQLHCNFRHHAEGVIRFLRCEDDKASVAAAVARWDGRELETRLSDAGLCAAFVRSREDWEAGEQSRAIAALPVLEVKKIGESAAEPAGTDSRPLAGVRVLDLTRVIAGPVGGRTLAAHGADVLRVTGAHLPGFADGLDIEMGHGKLSAALDLRTPEGAATMASLIEGADVFLQSYRPGSLAQRGYSPEALIARRPGLIYATLSAYGHVGPWRERRGFDSLTQSASGIVHEESGDGPPRHLPAQALDYVSGYLIAFGIMTALARRATEGGSYAVRTSLAQTGRWIQGLGRTPATQLGSTPDLKSEAMTHLLTVTDSAFGELTYLQPAGRMAETPPRWDRTSVPLGSSEPRWPGR